MCRNTWSRSLSGLLGETFVEEHKNSINSPFKFNGKELDEESGLYYYGARYYDPRLSIWASVDPLANFNPFMDDEHYIKGDHNGGVFNHFNQNSYSYCYQNPVKYVDPNGKQSQFQRAFEESMSGVIKSIKDIPSKVSNFIEKTKAYSPARNLSGTAIIDGNIKATVHYYRGDGDNVVLGPNTVNDIKNNDRVLKAVSNLKTGKSQGPASHSGGGVDITMVFDEFHLGAMKLKYSTTCDDKTCKSTFTVDDDGFVDPNFLAEGVGTALKFAGVDAGTLEPDGKGSNLEAGGDTYNYDPVIWTIEYKNPGYPIDKNGKPLPIKKEKK